MLSYIVERVKSVQKLRIRRKNHEKLLPLLLIAALLCGCAEKETTPSLTTTTTASTTTTATTTTNTTTTTPQATTTTTPQTTTTPETTTTSEPKQTDPFSGLTYTKKGETAIIAENYEYSEEDKELQEILAEKNEKICRYLMSRASYYIASPEYAESEGVDLLIKKDSELSEFPIEYILVSEEFPYETLAELETEIRALFSDDIAEGILGELTDIDNTDIIGPFFIEENGEIYQVSAEGGGSLNAIDISKSIVVSKSEEEIVFSYLIAYVSENVLDYYAYKGILKYEDDEWKLGYEPSRSSAGGYDFYEVWVN